MSPEKKQKAKVIRIQEKWCKRCGICVEFCPGKGFFLSAGGGTGGGSHGRAARFVGFVRLRCPDYAISVEEVSGS